MNTDFLSPISEKVVAQLDVQSPDTLGRMIKIHTVQNGFPDLEDVSVALVGVKEGRNGVDNLGCGEDLSKIREAFYKLFIGDWNLTIADIGNVERGNTVKDTYFAVADVVSNLVKNNIVVVLLGGSQDITYANYRAYDALEQTINLVSVDSHFDLGTLEDELNSESFLSKIIMEEANNLFNYSNIGYQTYLNSQQEVKLLQNLYFDTYRLGEVVREIKLVEPILRDADIVSVDIGSVRQSDAPANNNANPNGFFGDQLCAIARYAGISDKVTSFGVYEYSSLLDSNKQTSNLIAQAIWYFVEGVNYRAKDYPFSTKESYQKFSVILEDDDPINFYKSDKSGRWWMEINLITDNKYRRHALIPCAYQDYLKATEQKIPERWYKAQQKLT
ncbi:formimidoylglutamase [uncultured Tenacibaculum sp.]|uniref:formimidoylglutamase n=1 Tax=uncultured Tenacibaculum sp. TaxID=174713 RepID=UPI00262E93D7|nr:formimidoylglutamase [uncultured Tenacibaculum sp.]